MMAQMIATNNTMNTWSRSWVKLLALMSGDKSALDKGFDSENFRDLELRLDSAGISLDDFYKKIKEITGDSTLSTDEMYSSLNQFVGISEDNRFTSGTTSALSTLIDEELKGLTQTKAIRQLQEDYTKEVTKIVDYVDGDNEMMAYAVEDLDKINDKFLIRLALIYKTGPEEATKKLADIRNKGMTRIRTSLGDHRDLAELQAALKLREKELEDIIESSEEAGKKDPKEKGVSKDIAYLKDLLCRLWGVGCDKKGSGSSRSKYKRYIDERLKEVKNTLKLSQAYTNKKMEALLLRPLLSNGGQNLITWKINIYYLQILSCL
jgi:hypothetical protein